MNKSAQHNWAQNHLEYYIVLDSATQDPSHFQILYSLSPVVLGTLSPNIKYSIVK